MISEEKINEIIDKTDMVGLVSEFVTLQKRGKNYFGLCPFHADQTPSFSVSPSKKIAKCMSCGEGGNPINFLRKIKNVSFEEACFLLADRVGVQLERTKTIKHVDENSKYYEINQVAQKFYEHFLHNSQSGKEALEYLNKRGLDLETIKMFGIGLAPKNYTTFTKVLSDKGYSLTDAHDIGLITRKENDYYDMFFNRIMFPIIDEAGHVLGFSGRVFDDDTSGGKYVNTQETVIYKKGEMLYNLNNAIPHIRKMGRVILCEGQMDVISLSNAGIKEVVCSLGTALTEQQAALIKKYSNNVLICYDGDSAGVKATGKAFNLLKGLTVNSITLPNGMDPDEYLKSRGKDSFLEFIESNQKDVYGYLYSNAFLNRNLNVAYDYEEVKKTVFNLLFKSGSSLLVEKYLHQLAIDLKVSYDAIYNDYNIYFKQGSGQKNVEVLEETPKISKEMKAHEKWFIYFIAYNKNFLDYFKNEIGEVSDYIENEVILRTYQAIVYFYNSLNNEQNEIYKYCYDMTKNNFIYEVMKGVNELISYDVDKREKMLNDCIDRFKNVKYNMTLQEYVVETLEVTPETITTLDQKLKFARINNKKGK